MSAQQTHAVNKQKMQRFYFIANPIGKELALLDTTTGFLWGAQPDYICRDIAKKHARAYRKLGIDHWSLPSLEELGHFHAGNNPHPFRFGNDSRFFNQYTWLVREGLLNPMNSSEAKNWSISHSFFGKGYCLCVHRPKIQSKHLLILFLTKGYLIGANTAAIARELRDAYKENFYKIDFTRLFKVCAQNSLQKNDLNRFDPQQELHNNIDRTASHQIWPQKGAGLVLQQKAIDPLPEPEVGQLSDEDRAFWALYELNFEALSEIDSASCRLPQLEANQLSDQDKGLWELHGADTNRLQKLQIRSRNPALDVKDWPIAIDFGTSSTVVAYQEHGQKKLLRIGVKDHFSPPEASHFENPTVLEFVDLPRTLQPWQTTAYRPQIKWGDVRCSHEALSRLRDNEGDLSITTSVLAKIKHWALREAKDIAVCISDQVSQIEMELPPLTLRNPTKGQKLGVSPDDPFDPIELYAWFLGLTINWRQRGIFLKYYMTFPVAYPQMVKDKILASFRRGLQRSLPESLISQQIFNEFSVTERASEPAAFAATALPYFGIEPTEEGVAYGVFDFGGGTTDFDFGLYREPTPEEEDEGYEEVFEHFGASGDKFLGGENLLENLAYEVFKANQALCREKKIAFTKPLDADDFPGSEMLLEKTRAAYTNTQMLMSRLRPYWESREQNSQGIEKLNLINRSGESISCELTLPYDELESFLNQRLAKGVINFFSAMHKAFNEAGVQPQKVHIFLAGNASLSPALQSIFGLNCEGEGEGEGNEGEQDNPAFDNPCHRQVAELTDHLFGALDIDFEVHAPISQSEGNPYQATTKTGVALGLLDLCPGSAVKVVNRAVLASNGEAPFDHYVGCIKRRVFKPGLKRHAQYGQWHELGPVREGTFVLVSSQSPVANTGTVPQDDPALTHKRLTFAHAQSGERVFARAIAPDQIEITTAAHTDALRQEDATSLQVLNLAG